MTVIDHSSHWDQYEEDGKGDASNWREEFHDLGDIKYIAVESAEYKDRIEGPKESDIGK
jgi:hypothetical protein